jgi:hypothetical protein
LWNSIQEQLRRIIFRKIGHIVTTIQADFHLFRSKYGKKAIQVDAFVPIPGEITTLPFTPVPRKPGDEISLLLGNSATPSNFHQDALEKLSRSPLRKRLTIYCPLSYGDPAYAREVRSFGEKLFQERFIGMMEFLPPDQYYDILSRIDLAIMNHDRQQALGNIFALLYIGKKVYIRDDNPIFDYFGERGMVVGDVKEIYQAESNSALILGSEQAIQNHRIMEKLLSTEHYQHMWGPILNKDD